MKLYPCAFLSVRDTHTAVGLVGNFCLIELGNILVAYLWSDYGRNTWLLIIVIFLVSFLTLFDYIFEILKLLSDSDKIRMSIENIETK